MTEAEWLACDDPTSMLTFVRGRVTDRKLRLLGCACCFRIRATLFDSTETIRLLEGIERFADGKIEPAELVAIGHAHWRASTLKWRNTSDPAFAAESAVGRLWPEVRIEDVMRSTCEIATYEAYCQAADRSSRERSYRWWRRGPKLSGEQIQKAQSEGMAAERLAQTALLRDIFGNPFRPAALDPAWRTSTAVALAKHIYESRDFSAMPILADALQDADCDNVEILDHCRDAKQVHVRGCWVVDLVLGKE
jgi:hypothetical protein